MSRAIEIDQRLRLSERLSDALDEVIELLPAPAFIVATGARLLCANAHGRRLLNAGDGLRVASGALTGSTPAATAALRGACGDPRAHGPTANAPGHYVSIPRRGARPLRLLVLPVRNADRPGIHGRCPAAVILADDSDLKMPADRELLRAAYGLTHAEADVAVRITAGQPLRDIAHARRSTLHTIQWFNKQILSKTGCRTRAELVRMIALGIPTLAARP